MSLRAGAPFAGAGIAFVCCRAGPTGFAMRGAHMRGAATPPPPGRPLLLENTDVR